jgi:hypothetical protein
LAKIVRKYKDEIKDAKCKEIQDKIKLHKNDPKKLWRVLKSMYKDEKREINSVEIEGDIITDSADIALNLNEFFVDSVEEVVKNIPNSINVDYIERIVQRESIFEINVIEMSELKTIVKNLNKKTFHDNINGKMIEDALVDEKFAEELLNLINESIASSMMPKCLKTSVVTPIPKVAKASKPEDFRPINNLPVIEKIIEYVVKSQLT